MEESHQEEILRIVTEIRTVQVKVTEPLLKKIGIDLYDKKEGLVFTVANHETAIQDLNRLKWLVLTLILTAVLGGILKLVIR